MSHYEVTLLLWYELSEMAKDTIVKIVELPRKEKNDSISEKTMGFRPWLRLYIVSLECIYIYMFDCC